MTLFPTDPPTAPSDLRVYKRQYGKTTFARLGEYCQYLYQGEPLFRTVGNDSTFYGPPTAINSDAI